MKMTSEDMVGRLIMTSMKVNYAEFILTRTKEKADAGMLTIFGQQWETASEKIIFWYENEFVRDENGEVILPQKAITLTDCRLKNYSHTDDFEVDNIKRWHRMDDQTGKTHVLDVSPYVHLTPTDTKAFTEIAIRLGRVPTREEDNNGANFDSKSIAALLTRLEDEQSYHRDMAEMDQQSHQWEEQDIEEYQERVK